MGMSWGAGQWCAVCSKNTGSALGIVRQGQQEARRGLVHTLAPTRTPWWHPGSTLWWQLHSGDGAPPRAPSVVRTSGTLAVGFSIVNSLPNV